MTVSRRGVLGLAAAAAAAVAAGCSRAVPTPTGGPAQRTTEPGSLGLRPQTSASTPTAPARRSLGPAAQYAHGPRSRDEVALTFHGAGDVGIARELLTIFAEHRALVTVLGVGTWLAAEPNVARDIVAGGHELGNHTYRHLDIDNLDTASARDEIVRCRDLLTSLVGSGGAHFRQSQARTATARVRQLAGAAGYRACLSYDIDSLDYTDPGAQTVRANVRPARPGSIISMHFGHPGTVTAMPHILDDLAARGLRPVTATRLLRP